MRLLFDGGHITVDCDTSDEEEELRRFAEENTHLAAVRKDSCLATGLPLHVSPSKGS